MCVGNDDDIRSVSYGDDGALAGLGEGGVLVDHTTASADIARELAAAKPGARQAVPRRAGLGRPGGCRERRADGDVRRRAERASIAPSRCMAAYAPRGHAAGAGGAGQLTKMVNQICIAGLVAGPGRGDQFRLRAGLDMEQVIDGDLARAPRSPGRWRTAPPRWCRTSSISASPVDWMRKDLEDLHRGGQRNGALLPVTALVDEFYAQVEKAGGKRWDTSSLIHNLRLVD